ncbi:MFS transporter [Rhizobium laguerreae]|uniref:MFS transporter n=1 Tax=Rhizobium laguerreae TaxID=1076926 RepID=UPI001FED5B30|nr:MFS transporter [Rhizobium laguerreae]
MRQSRCALYCLSLAFTSNPIIATLALVFGGAGWVITWVGRTLSIYHTCLSGGIAAGSWIWGHYRPILLLGVVSRIGCLRPVSRRSSRVYFASPSRC